VDRDQIVVAKGEPALDDFPAELFNHGTDHIEAVMRLRDQTGETVLVGKRLDRQAVYLEVLESPHSIRYSPKVGEFRPLHASASGKALLRLPSGELRRVPDTCRASIGQIGNPTHENESGGKAGRSRWQGKRPTVRGTAMNPVDHPHGGGEGKNKGSHPVTPWGKPTLGRRTRDPNKASSAEIVRGRRRGKGRK